MALVIGISGKARAGKDTLFAFAAKEGFIRLSFADDLKARARRDFGLTVEHTDGHLKEIPCDKLGGFSPRDFLIDLGNLYRKYRPTFWVDVVAETIKQNPDKNYVITDVRYPNEAAAIKSVGGLMVRIERHPDRDAMVPNHIKKSISETAMDDYGDFNFLLPGEQNRVPADLEKFWSEITRDAVKK